MDQSNDHNPTHTHHQCAWLAGGVSSKTPRLLRIQGFRGNLTHRPNEAQTQNAIIVKSSVDIGLICSGYQATLAVHRCKLHLYLLITSVSPSVGYNIFIETLF